MEITKNTLRLLVILNADQRKMKLMAKGLH